MDLLALNEKVRAEAAKVIVGQDEAFTQVLVAFLSGGRFRLWPKGQHREAYGWLADGNDGLGGQASR